MIDLADGTAHLLKLMFDKEDIDEKFEALLTSVVEEFRGATFSFDDVLTVLKRRLHSARNRGYITIGDTSHHSATVTKLVSRLEYALESMDQVIAKNQVKTQKYIKLTDLIENGLWVINIEPLDDRCKRLVFLSVLRPLQRILEVKRDGKTTVTLYNDRYDISKFPARVLVFVDELNKFAPSGREYSPVKAPIVDIAARGRSVGLSLLGAQQSASQVDTDVITNSSTFVLGRCHPLELRGAVYEWLQGGLRQRVLTLPQGQLVVYHAMHNAPVLVNFPIPLHDESLRGLA